MACSGNGAEDGPVGYEPGMVAPYELLDVEVAPVTVHETAGLAEGWLNRQSWAAG
jgi:hypothetical protein